MPNAPSQPHHMHPSGSPRISAIWAMGHPGGYVYYPGVERYQFVVQLRLDAPMGRWAAGSTAWNGECGYGDGINLHSIAARQARRQIWRGLWHRDGESSRIRSLRVTGFLLGRHLAAVEQVATEIHRNSGVAYVAKADVLDEQAVQDHLGDVAQQAGSIDILRNAMGPQAKDYGKSTSTLNLLWKNSSCRSPRRSPHNSRELC